MKARIFFTVLFFTVFCLGVQAKVKDAKAITGSSLSAFGKYSVELSDIPMKLDGKEVKTYELTYENAERSVMIGVLPERNCTNFILKTDMFEIEYVCNKGIFGVKKIQKEYANISKDVNEAVLDKVGYYAQRVITQNPKTEEELLGLIACYFPALVKDDYQAKF
ncbi:MAG: hypothetical protein JXR31_14690 [Prolixibacteraceae bacterium]|nr:hypothetical protein [Prolixibacteraceae bacterium]MBN2775500.1 hypothetical protein [Prolixibacteraceae bacterium]